VATGLKQIAAYKNCIIPAMPCFDKKLISPLKSKFLSKKITL